MEFAMAYRKSRKFGGCCVSGCDSKVNKNFNLSFHRVPEFGSVKIRRRNLFGTIEVVDKRTEWLKKLNIKEDNRKYLLVCSLHFDENDYWFPEVDAKARTLKRDAIPKSCNVPIGKIRKNAQRQKRFDERLLKKQCRTNDSIKGKEKIKKEMKPIKTVLSQQLIQGVCEVESVEKRIVPKDDLKDCAGESEEHDSACEKFDEWLDEIPVEFSPNQKEDICTEVIIKSEPPEFESIDVKNLMEDQRKITNLSDNHKNDPAKNPANNSKTLVIKPEKLHRCNQCPQEFKNTQGLSNHNRIHTKKKRKTARKKDLVPDKCPVCAKEFTNTNSLKVHVFRHHSEIKPFECEVCKKCFPTKYDLDIHMYMHDTKKSFVCDICSKAFRQLSYLNNHKKTHLEKRPYACKTCGKRFMKPYLLNIHVRYHTGETPFECDICKKQFTNRNTLRMHISTHIEGGGPHKCSFCGKGFVRRCRLKIHLQIHSGVKPYTCNVCKKGFTRKDSLTAHMAVHESIESFGCEICFKEFPKMSVLKIHKNSMHSNDEPIDCESCGKSFSNRRQLGRHKLCHNGEIFECNICKKTLKNKRNLKMHKKLHKREEDVLKEGFETVFVESSHNAENESGHISANEEDGAISAVKTELTSEIEDESDSILLPGGKKFYVTSDLGLEIDIEDVKIEVEEA